MSSQRTCHGNSANDRVIGRTDAPSIAHGLAMYTMPANRAAYRDMPGSMWRVRRVAPQAASASSTKCHVLKMADGVRPSALSAASGATEVIPPVW